MILGICDRDLFALLMMMMRLMKIKKDTESLEKGWRLMIGSTLKGRKF